MAARDRWTVDRLGDVDRDFIRDHPSGNPVTHRATIGLPAFRAESLTSEYGLSPDDCGAEGYPITINSVTSSLISVL